MRLCESVISLMTSETHRRGAFSAKLAVEYVYLEISDTGPQSGQANTQEEGNMRRGREKKRVTEEERESREPGAECCDMAAGPWRR